MWGPWSAEHAEDTRAGEYYHEPPPSHRGKGTTKLKGSQVVVGELFIYTVLSAVVVFLYEYDQGKWDKLGSRIALF